MYNELNWKKVQTLYDFFDFFFKKNVDDPVLLFIDDLADDF